MSFFCEPRQHVLLVVRNKQKQNAVSALFWIRVAETFAEGNVKIFGFT